MPLGDSLPAQVHRGGDFAGRVPAQGHGFAFLGLGVEEEG